ncbi:MAG TPA: hypothetical protein PLO50_01645 [Nitrospira sp.]|nr:hypothetical protein [Nitrospira sp.]
MTKESVTEWGACKHCQWWQIEPEARITDNTVGYCIEETLQPYRLSITGNGGCNRYGSGTPARGDGSSRQPPEAVPTR